MLDVFLKRVRQFDFGLISKYRLFLMGFSTIWILLYHSPIKFTRVDGDGLNHLLYILDYYIYLFISLAYTGVCIFMFLSGVSLYYSMKKNNNYLDFIVRRLKRIIPEYLFVNVVWSCYKKRSILDTIMNITGVSFLQNNIRENWFFIMIIALYIVYPIIFYCKNNFGNWTVIVMFMLSIIINWLVSVLFPTTFDYIEIALRSISIFFVGVFFSDYVYEKRSINGAIVYPHAIICFYLSYSFIVNETNSGSVLLRYIYGLNSISFIVISVFLISLLDLSRINKIFEYIGKYSMECYLLFERILFVLSNYISSLFLLIPISILLCFISSYLLKTLQNKLIN